MARIRSFKPELWLSPQVMNLCHGARLLFLGMITQADDEGRGTADPRKLKASIFPGDEDVTIARIKEWCADTEGQGLAVFYDDNGHGRLYQLTGFTTHQSINKPTKSRYPKPPARSENGHSLSASGGLPENSGRTPEGSDLIGSEGSEGSDLTRARAAREQPVSNSGRRAPAPDHLKKTSGKRERGRQAASAILAGLARAKS